MNKKSENPKYILTPIVLLLVTQATAILLGGILQKWVFIPIILIYWIALALILRQYGFEHIKKWLQKPKGHWGWIILAVVLGFSSLPMFLSNLSVFKDPMVLILSTLFFLINPWLEEFYWRGLLLDITDKWAGWISVLYSSIFFAAFHSAFAWNSAATRNVPFYVAVLVLGVGMAWIYKKTQSLWLCIASHMLINILNMGIPTIMNLIEI